jgi:beta-N-acetylhexosaminidase
MAGAAVAALRAGCDLLCLGTENTDAQLADIEQAVQDAIAEDNLANDRVSNAASRVLGLGRDLAAARATAGPPPDLVPVWRSGREVELADTFDLQPRASAWRSGAAGRYALVRLEAAPNIAAGHIPWGPFADLGPELVEGRFDELSAHLISPGQSRMPSFQSNEPVLVVGRDIHRHAFARDAVDRLRTAGVDVLVVDMGWPSEDRRYADVATFGASALMGRALLTWLGLEANDTP